jgi:predicted site-specific integrase-resolvase
MAQMQTAQPKPPARAGYQGNRGNSIQQAAAALGCSVRTLWRRIGAGEIKSVKISERRRVVTDSEIARILSGDGDADAKTAA